MRKIAAALMFCLALSSCQDDEPEPSPNFKNGQMVKMKAFDAVGMVRVAYHYKNYGWVYEVRFPAMQITTDTRILSDDGPLQFSPVALVKDIREFELEPAK